jgi:uncharacterized protein (TIGR00266 family)
MKVDIQYRPAYSLAIVDLDAGESVQAESGAMVSMTGNVAIETAMKGGLLGAVKRKILGGESLFANTYTAQGAPGQITLAPSLPGDVGTLTLGGGTMFIQSGSYLAGSTSIDLDTQWGGARSFFGSEGLFLLRASGHGEVILSTYGAIHKVDITSGQPYRVDTGHVVAFGQGLEFQVERVGGWKSTILSGEGLVCTFRGSGPLYLQTRSTQAFLSWLIPRLGNRPGGGGGGASGVLGNILRGD